MFIIETLGNYPLMENLPSWEKQSFKYDFNGIKNVGRSLLDMFKAIHKNLRNSIWIWRPVFVKIASTRGSPTKYAVQEYKKCQRHDLKYEIGREYSVLYATVRIQPSLHILGVDRPRFTTLRTRNFIDLLQ